MTTKLEVSGCHADENPSERPARCADLSVSDGSSLREDSDRQGVALDDCESGTGSCDGLKETAVLGSCDADSLEATPTRPRSALKVAAGSAGANHYAGAEYNTGQPHAHADDYEHGVHSEAQLGTYNESVSGTYGHVHDLACEPSAAYYNSGGYGDNSYGADGYSTAGGYDGGTGGGYDWDGYNGGYDEGGDDGDYGGNY